MAQLLANELLLMIFKELLNDTSFDYMNSICSVCKKWKELIKVVLVEEIESRLKTKLLIEFDDHLTEIEIISYDFSSSAFNILIECDHTKLFSNKYGRVGTMCINFKYENNIEEYLVELDLGTVFFNRRSRRLRGNSTTIEWNFKDCECTISIKEVTNTVPIAVEKLIISLKKMGVILDLLDENLNTEDCQYKYIIKRKPRYTFDYHRIFNRTT